MVLAPIDQHWASMMISGPPRSLQIPVCVQSGYALWYGLFHLSPLRYVKLQCSIVFHLLGIPVLFQLRCVFFRMVLRAICIVVWSLWSPPVALRQTTVQYHIPLALNPRFVPASTCQTAWFLFCIVLASIDRHWASMMISGSRRTSQVAANPRLRSGRICIVV